MNYATLTKKVNNYLSAITNYESETTSVKIEELNARVENVYRYNGVNFVCTYCDKHTSFAISVNRNIFGIKAANTITKEFKRILSEYALLESKYNANDDYFVAIYAYKK